jgi:U3 small nucleolar RNA-associated protein 11
MVKGQGFSSLRNAVKRRTHKERAQPRHRRSLGLLEKKKDYVKRAKDHHKKMDRLRVLQEKASMRNPDEFYFKMKGSKTEGGVHLMDKDNVLADDIVRVMKTQDMSYVNMKRAVDAKKSERLKKNLHFLMDRPLNNHTIYKDTEEEVEEFDAAEHFDTVPELAQRAYNRPRKETLKKERISAPTNTKTLQKAMKEGAKKYDELSQRVDRMGKLDSVLAHQQSTKNAMGKGQKKKIQNASGGKPAQYKFKQKRSR